VACIGDTITFTASGVVDSGGVKRVFCSAKQWIPPVSPTYTWVLSVPPDYPPPLPPLTGTGAAVSIVAEVPGTYSVTFTATANRDCPPPPITIGPATKDTCQSGTVAYAQVPTCGITVTLKAITFLADHEMHENADPGTWGAGDALLPPDWQDVNSADNAISYTRGASLQMQVRVEIEASGIETPTLRVTGPDGIQGTSGVTSACGTNQRTVTITTTPLPNYVNRYEPMMLDWSFQRQGETTWTAIRSTMHQVFVSYGTPGFDDPVNGPLTQRRMQTLCGVALDAGTALEVVDGVEPFGAIGIHAWLAGNPPEDGNAGTIPPWDLMWYLMAGLPYTGECHQQAHLMNLAIRLIGVGGGREYKVRASADPLNIEDVECKTAGQLGITRDLDGDGGIGEEVLCLYFDFNPPNGAINFFEGAVELPWGHYAVWPSLKANSGCLLLRALGDPQLMAPAATQHWMYIPGITDPTGGGSVSIEQQVHFPTCP
jgi:hypothetical protein